MLNLSKIDNGELHLRVTRFDMTAALLEALLSFEKRIEEKQLQILGLENAESLFVDADRDMIYQVLYNLIENAVKFTPDEGFISVHLGRETDRTRVSIRNSGPGIAPDEVQMVFDRFYKTDRSRNKDKTGMGLGLYIVRTIVRQHGGEITAASVPDEYTEFSFYLPDIRKGTAADALPKLKEPVRKSRPEKKTKNRRDSGAAGKKTGPQGPEEKV